MYIITNYTCIRDKWFDSEPLEYKEAMKEFTIMLRQFRRGLRDREPELIKL